MPQSESTYQRARDSYLAALQRSIDRRAQKALVKQKGGIDAARDAQQEAAQARRDKMQQLYEQQNASQRAGINADSAAQQHRYTSQRDKQQQLDQLQRDAQQQGYTLQRDDRQFGQETQRDRRQHGNQLERDAIQQGYTTDRDRQQFGYDSQRSEQQFGQQIQRDTMQDTFSSRRERQQQKDLLQRDRSQFGFDTQREQQQNEYQSQRDQRLQGFDVQNDERQFGQQQQRDERLQGYDVQNATQRETFDVTAKWQDQVNQARNNGMDFSETQRKQMNDMDSAFRTNVLNGPFDEGQKQEAMLQYQRKLSAIIPNDRVRNPQDQLQQSLLFDERVPGVPFMMGYDSQGRPTFEPLGSSGGGAKQEDPEKTAAELRKLNLERDHSLAKMRKEVASETDPETEARLFKTPDEIDEETLKRFSADENFYQESGLPRHGMYEMSAQRQQQKKQKAGYDQWYEEYKEQQKQRPAPPQRSEQRRQMQPQGQPPAPGGQQPATQPPVLSSKSQLPPDVVKQLKAVPGGTQLGQIREKHKSNSVLDQTVRQATDIVLNSMLTKDTSDPDLAEAIDILKRAGFKMEQ